MGSSSSGRALRRGPLLAGAVGVLLRPWLWATALRLAFQAVPRGWWRESPRVPRPDADFIAFRVSTAYGEAGTPRAAELVEYLEWVRAHRRARRAAD